MKMRSGTDLSLMQFSHRYPFDASRFEEKSRPENAPKRGEAYLGSLTSDYFAKTQVLRIAALQRCGDLDTLI